jgi:LCP family protein required for cell wall assembly
VLIAGLVCLVLAAAGLIGARHLAERYDRTVRRAELLDDSARRAGPNVLTGPLNYLVIGSDLRVSHPAAGQRADTIIIAHIPAAHDRAYLISIPRDLLVTLPPYAPTGYPGGKNKINAAFQYGRGGTQLLSAAITRLAGITFDGATIIEFSGFRRVIDLLGGVTVCVDQDVRSIHTGHLFVVGCHRMSGAVALDYARQRYDLPRGDWDRQRHQQQLLKAIMKEAAGTGLLTNPVRLDQLVRAVGGSLTVDTGGVPLSRVVFTLRDLRAQGLTGLRLPAHGDMIDGVSYAIAGPAAAGLFAALRGDDLGAWAAAHTRWVNPL